MFFFSIQYATTNWSLPISEGPLWLLRAVVLVQVTLEQVCEDNGTTSSNGLILAQFFIRYGITLTPTIFGDTLLSLRYVFDKAFC